MDSFIDAYLLYMRKTEPPYIYHRWCALSSIAALLGRNFYFQFGHFKVYPNLYCILIGEAGSRKSTAIKLTKKLVAASGYQELSADKTSKEKFLLDLEGRTPDEEYPDSGGKAKKDYDLQTAINLWGHDAQDRTYRQMYVVADEFNEFIGIANNDFCTTLGNLWDWDDEERPFTSRLKNSRSVSIWQPTITILGGNTPENYSKAFPPAIIGNGFLSRLLHIYGERSDRKFTFPPEPDKDETDKIIAWMQQIRQISGKATVTPEADKLLDEIYQGWQDIDDVRFKSYSNRRFTQLLKLCLCISAANSSTVFTESTVITANTYLSAAEHLMPKALGEFGKSKHSEVAQKIMELLDTSLRPLLAKAIWTHVHKDLDKVTDLQPILQGLSTAEKIQYVPNAGWLSKKKVAVKPQHVDWSLLTEEERRMLGNVDI